MDNAYHAHQLHEALANLICAVDKGDEGSTAKALFRRPNPCVQLIRAESPDSAETGCSGVLPDAASDFGGEHADVVLGAIHGESIAEIVATSNTPAIIDTSLMRVGERTRFFTDFANELLRKNKGPLHLFIDECHLFMPQGRVADPQSGNMLHAANNLISLGRARGLRVTLISQRPAKVHKDSLTQIETMIVNSLAIMTP
jgi:hypothetical protein